ncbi:phosphoribosyl-AMP cyclohydrolase [Clostridium thermarum]|uniref:phosphoribosyl-AMP cyclohydrolase n=1 Tax=Clostridium thermarum TaxID=1716543 RepID=UPI0013CF617D|nr:phosphoribosyl-AMP cyclohydrolase [Clostridium thermarum]
MTEIKNLKYNADGLIPAIVQHYQSKEVLMLAYMNEESIRLTLKTGKTWFWSRSRKKLWNKGESSGHFQYVKDIFIDCDQDTLLILVDQIGPACHTGSFSCFYRRFNQ